MDRHNRHTNSPARRRIAGSVHLAEHLDLNALKVHLDVQIIEPLPADDLRDIAMIADRCYKESSGAETPAIGISRLGEQLRARPDHTPTPAAKNIRQTRAEECKSATRLTDPPDVADNRLPIDRHRQRLTDAHIGQRIFRPSGRFGRQFSE